MSDKYHIITWLLGSYANNWVAFKSTPKVKKVKSGDALYQEWNLPSKKRHEKYFEIIIKKY